MMKFNTGTKLRQNPKKIVKNWQKIAKLTKNRVILVLYQWATFKIMNIRTPAVQHKKLTKKIFHLYINGSTQE